MIQMSHSLSKFFIDVLKKIFWKRENQNLHYSDFTHIFSVTILQKKKKLKKTWISRDGFQIPGFNV